MVARGDVMNRKEEIVISTLNLASEIGLDNVSMSMIANSIGIKKASLYKHFKSKDDIINEMYAYLREQSKDNISLSIDFNLSAYEILKKVVDNYILMTTSGDLYKFFKIIYSQRSIDKMACNILVCETNKMIDATANLFNIFENKRILHFNNIKISALSFSLTIHGLIDNLLDLKMIGVEKNNDEIYEYINYFCKENEI